jgi:hypothetical protein
MDAAINRLLPFIWIPLDFKRSVAAAMLGVAALAVAIRTSSLEANGLYWPKILAQDAKSGWLSLGSPLILGASDTPACANASLVLPAKESPTAWKNKLTDVAEARL